VVITHDLEVARHADRVVSIVDGRIVGDSRTADAVRTPMRLEA